LQEISANNEANKRNELVYHNQQLTTKKRLLSLMKAMAIGTVAIALSSTVYQLLPPQSTNTPATPVPLPLPEPLQPKAKSAPPTTNTQESTPKPHHESTPETTAVEIAEESEAEEEHPQLPSQPKSSNIRRTLVAGAVALGTVASIALTTSTAWLAGQTLH
jgi:hypothetical protein